MRYFLALIFNTWKLYIGIMFVSTLLLLYPIFIIFLSSERLKPNTFKLNVLWSRVMRMLCFYAIEKEGDAKDVKAPFIVCANHTSYLDIFLMYSVLPKHRFLFMGKSEILSYPLIKTFFKRLNIPVFRDNRLKAAKSFIRARQEMNKGWSIIIFPEGGIPNETPYVIPFKDGAFKLAKSSQVGILPITFLDNYKLFSDPENVFDSARPGLSRVVFHDYIDEGQVEKTELSNLNNKVFKLISGSLPQKD